MLKILKRSWEPFRSCLPNSAANPANWTGLAVLSKSQVIIEASYLDVKSSKKTNQKLLH